MFKVSRIFFGFMLFVPFYVYGEEIKFGIGATSGGGVNLYMPITRGELFVEPTFNYSRSKDKQSSGYTSVSNGTSPSNNSASGNNSGDYKSIGVGIGIFRRHKVAENIYLYGGGRVGYFKIKGTSSSYSSDANNSWSETGLNKGHGYYISPSIGVEREFSDSFSIGLELAYGYTKQRSEDRRVTNSSLDPNSYSSSSYSSESKRYSAGTNIIGRYRF